MRNSKSIIFSITTALILVFNLGPAFAADMNPDEIVDFTLTVTNSGPATIGSVSGTATIDGGFSISPTTFSVTSIPVRSSKTFIFKVKSPPASDADIVYGKATFNITKAKDTSGKETKFVATLGKAIVSAGDTIPPQITISGVTDGGTYTPPVTVSYVVTDNNLDVSSVRAYWGERVEIGKAASSNTFIAPGYHIVTVSAKDLAENPSSKTVSFTIKKDPDNPDDNESTSSPISENIGAEPSAKIALLQRGFYPYAGELLTSLNEPFELIDTNFSASISEEYSILIIPTGGLFGMENSDFFKAKLQEYVENGGRLVCFSQQHGYEFNALPRPSPETSDAVSGYGWQEDQSCYYNALYINKYHQILSGQPDSSITTSVDGYFTQWPENSLSILNRSKNGMPALIMYDVGKGKVIATTSYLDWGYKNWQFSEPDDRRLMRDIIGWLREARQLPQYKPTDTVNLDVTVSNETTSLTAKQVTVHIKDPDGKDVATQEYLTDIIPGGNTLLNISYQLSDTSSWGIWQISYELKDGQAGIIQEEKIAARFVVTALQISNISQDITVDIVSDAEYFALGSSGVFVVNIGNNTDAEKIITIKPYLVHNSSIVEVKQVVVSAHSRISVEYVIENISNQGWFRVTLYDGTGQSVGYADRGFFVYSPSVSFGVSSDKKLYAKGDNVNISVDMRNNREYTSNFTLSVMVTNPLGSKIWERSSNIEINRLESLTQTFTLPLEVYMPGIYIVKVDGGYASAGRIGSASTYFEVSKAQLSITPDMSAFSQPDHKVIFNIKNIGLIDVDSAELNAVLFSAKGEVIYHDTKGFSLSSGQTTAVDFLLTLPALEFGRYTLNYYLDNRLAGQIYIDNNYTIDANFDKTSYSVRETLNASVKITNSGKFKQALTLITRVGQFNAEHSDTITLSPAESLEVKHSFLIPENTPSGTYAFEASLNSADSVLTKSFNFVVPESLLKAGINSSHFIAGSPLEFWVKNIGGVDTTYISNISLKDPYGVIVYSNEFSGSVIAGSQDAKSFIIPTDIVDTSYTLSIECKNVKTQKMSRFTYNVYIKAMIKASLDVSADKDVYLIDEPINIKARIDNQGIAFKGSLTLELLRKGEGFESIPNKDNVKLIKEDGEDLWVVYDHIYGIGQYSLTKKNWKFYNQINSPLPNGSVNDIAVDQDNVWFATDAGLWRYRKADDLWQVYQGERYELINNLWTKLPANCGLVGNYIDKILLDGGKIWLVTTGRKFGSTSIIKKAVINLFDPSNDTWQSLKKEDIGFIGHYIDWISSDERSIWIGTNGYPYYEYSFGLSRYDKASKIWQTFTDNTLDQNIVYSVADETDIWMGMGYGVEWATSVLRYNKATQEWIQYTSQNSGLTSDRIKEIFLRGDDVWFIYRDYERPFQCGISRFNKLNQTWGIYTPPYSIPWYYYIDGLIKEDKLWIADHAGVSIYDILLDSWSRIDTFQSSGFYNTTGLFGGQNIYITFNNTTDINYIEPNTAASYTISQSGVPYGYNTTKVFADGEDVWFVSPHIPSTIRYSAITDEFIEHRRNRFYYFGFDSVVFDGEQIWFYNNYYGTSILSKYNKVTDTWAWHFSPNYYPYNSNPIGALAVINNEVWCGGRWGLSIYDKSQDSWTFLSSVSGIDLRYITKISYSGEDVFLALSENFYLPDPCAIVRHNLTTGLWQTYNSGNSPIVDYERIFNLLQTEDDLWVMGQLNIYRYALKDDEWFVYHPGSQYYYGWQPISALDADKKLWFAPAISTQWGRLTYNGKTYYGTYRTFTLYRYDKVEDKWVEYKKEDFLTSYSVNYGGEIINVVLQDWPLCVNEIRLIVPTKDSVVFVGVGGASIYDISTGIWQNNSFNLDFIGGAAADTALWYVARNLGVIKSSLDSSVWKRQVPVEVNDTLLIEDQINNLNLTGKFLLKGALSLENGQMIAEDYDTFYVTKDALVLTLDTDKQVYKPAEPINVTGKVINTGELPLADVVITVKKDESKVFSETVNLDGKDSYTFSFTLQSKETFKLQAEAADASLNQIVTIESPDLNVSLNAPDVVGQGDFLAEVILENIRQVSAQVSVQIEGEAFNVTVSPKSTQHLYKTFNILEDKVIDVSISGDVNKQLQKSVHFAEKIDVQVTSQEVYAEGAIEIPVLITNTGELDSFGNIIFDLYDANDVPVYQKTLTYDLAKSEVLNTSLSLDLKEGSYTLKYSSFVGDGVKQFKVAKFNQVGLEAAAGPMQSGRIPLAVTATNLGGNSFYGKLNVEAPGVLEEMPLELNISEAETFNLEIKPVGAMPGNYTIEIIAEYSGNVAAQKNITSFIRGAEFKMVNMPASVDLNAGESITLTFTVKNTGEIAGRANLSLRAMDLMNESREIWLETEETQNLTFDLSVPSDFGKGDYALDCLLNGKAYYIPLNISGIDVKVDACLDKNIYFLGETAKLTIDVTNLNNSITSNMYALVRYKDNEQRQDFTLAENNQVVFNIPINELLQEKIFYGLYLADGKSVYINDVDLPVGQEEISLWTDKQIYLPQDEVTIFAESNIVGNLKVSTIGYEEEMTLDGRITRTFTLPVDLAGGTYVIDYSFNNKSYKAFFNVKADKVKILSCNLDKNKYLLQDLIKTVMLIESEKETNVDLKVWSQSPSYKYVKLLDIPYVLSKGQNTVNMQANFVTEEIGIHGFNYGIFKAGTDNLLASGSELFDVGGAVLISVATEKQIYYPNEEVKLLVGTFGSGSMALDVYVDDISVLRTNIDVNGSTNTELSLGQFAVGQHKVVAVLGAVNVSQMASSFEVIDNTPPETKDDYVNPQMWRNIDVHITLSATDDHSGVKVTYYSIDNLETKEGTAIVVSAEGAHSIEYWSEDNAGNIEDKHYLVVKIDKTAPAITAEISPHPNSSGWNNTDVTVNFIANDAISGIATLTGPIIVTTEGVGQDIAGEAVDLAGNKATANVILNIDKTSPQVIISTPADGAEYILNSSILASWSATDVLSGLLSATGTIPNGGVIDTATVGPKTFSVVATDNAGNKTERPLTYYVRYNYSGVLPPINQDGSSVFKLGRTIPVKFQLKDDAGNFVSTAVARIYLNKVSDSVLGTEIEAESVGEANSGNLFRYDATDNQYIFNLGTNYLSQGTWQIRIALDDGSSKYVNISLK